MLLCSVAFSRSTRFKQITVKIDNTQITENLAVCRNVSLTEFGGKTSGKATVKSLKLKI